MGDKLKEIPTQGALVRTDQLRECVFSEKKYIVQDVLY